MIKNTSDITIIGSGIIGLLTAKYCLQAHATVTILEKNPTSQEASWAGGGILLPLYPWRQAPAISELVIPSLKHYPLLDAELMAETKIAPEWTQCGLLITQNPDLELATNWCKTAQLSAITADANFFSSLNSQFLHPLWLPSIAQVRNPRLLKSLRAFLVQKGVRFIDNCTLTAIVQNKQRVDAIETTQGKLAVQQLIIATGAWTGELAQTLFPETIGNVREIKPVKGQMLLFDAKPNLLNHIILEGEHYLIPRRDGKILAGSSVEYSGFDKSINTLTKDTLYNFATRLLPALKNFPVSKQWAGLRPGTQHGIPYIGIHPDIENLSINAGHFRNGLTMAPASAQLLVDLLLKRPLSIDPTPYQLTR